MKRLFLCLVLFALLAGTPRRAEAVPKTLKSAFESAAQLIDDRIAALPSPPVTEDDRAARTAWKTAERLVDDAIARPSPSRAVPLVASVDRTLVKAFGKPVEVLDVLGFLMLGLQFGTGDLLDGVRAKVMDLPPGRPRTKLLARLDTADAKLLEAGGAVSRSKARALLAEALRIAAAVEADRKALVKLLLKVNGLAAIADGELMTAKNLFSGSVATDVVTGKPLAIQLEWRKTTGNVSQIFWLRIDPTHQEGDPPEGVAGRTLERRTYATNNVYITAGYMRTVTGGGSTQIDSALGTGSITIVTLDTTDPQAGGLHQGHAAVSGYLSFQTPDISGPGTGLKVGASFNIPQHPKGPQLLPAVQVPFPKTSDR